MPFAIVRDSSVCGRSDFIDTSLNRAFFCLSVPVSRGFSTALDLLSSALSCYASGKTGRRIVCEIGRLWPFGHLFLSFPSSALIWQQVVQPLRPLFFI